MEDQEKATLREALQIEQRCKSGADWFFWIAGLSLINSAIILLGSEWSFLIGLGVTQFIDAVAVALAEEIGVLGKIIAFALDVVVACVFVVFGVLARKRFGWAFVAGMIVYALDGLLFLLVGDYLSLGFHCFALFCIYGGFSACRKLSQEGIAE